MGQTFEAAEALGESQDARVVAAMRARDLPVYFGNASRSELLRKVSDDSIQAAG